MGDSCFNPGMKSITQAVGKFTGTYAICIPTGSDQGSDTNNGFFMTMDKNVEVWAAAIAKNPELKNGFNAARVTQSCVVTFKSTIIHPCRRFCLCTVLLSVWPLFQSVIRQVR